MMRDDFENKEYPDQKNINQKNINQENINQENINQENTNQQNTNQQTPEQQSGSGQTDTENTEQRSSVYRYSRDQINGNGRQPYHSYGSNDQQPYHTYNGHGNDQQPYHTYSSRGNDQNSRYHQENGYENSYNSHCGSGYENPYGGGTQGSSMYGNYSGSAYGGHYGSASGDMNSQGHTYGQNGTQNSGYGSGAEQYRQSGRYQRPPKQKKTRKPVKMRGWMKVVCYALIFGIVSGGVFEGIHFAGNAIRGGSEDTPTSRTIDVVRVSSQDVKTIEAQDVSDIVSEVMPSIVSVNTVVEKTSADFFGRQYTQQGEGAGSGFIFSQDEDHLYLATNYHVIEDSKSITVHFNDGTDAEATVKGYDEDADIAVLLVDYESLPDETKKAIKVAVIGDSDALEAGNGAIAIGNALGYGQSVTTGAISAVERTVQLTDGEMSLIQTSAAINPGNSGGPLLNTRGEVIGINTVKYSETTVEGMGFAIPMNSAMETINDIISGKIVNKSDSDSVYFGIKGGTVTEALADKIGCPQGVYVSYVYAGSAAQRAGIQQGYIITKFDDKRISTIEELQEYLENYKPGDSVTVEVCYQDNNGNYENRQTLSTILGSRDEAPEEY